MGRRPKPRQKFFEKSFLDFQKLLSAETCGFGRKNLWILVQKTKFFAIQSS